MFGETEIDLQFSIFGIPVRVQPTFWILGAILGYLPGTAAALEVNVLAVMLLFSIVVFVSILVHELGHALVIERFGWPCRITLWHIGGYAAYSPGRGDSSAKRIAIALAGPFAGFLLCGLTLVVGYFSVRQGWFAGSGIAGYVFSAMVWVNLAWGLLNLLPVLPLDGGHVCEHLLSVLGVRNNHEWSLKIGILTAAGVAALCLTAFGGQFRFTGFLFLFLAVNNYQALQRRAW
jgi:stage IV sporulation protein FB